MTITKIKRFFAKNWIIKVVCLVAAVGLWIYVANIQNNISKFPGTIKINAFNTPMNLVAIYDDSEVQIKVMTQATTLQKLSTDSFSAFVDLSGLNEGTYDLSVNVVSLVPGVQIVNISPEKISVRLDSIVTKEVPISPKVEGSAGENMTTGETVFNPNIVKLTGAKSILDNINDVEAKIALDGETADFSRNVTLTLPTDANLHHSQVDISPSETVASVSIIKAANIKSVGVKANITGSVKSNYYIDQVVVNPDVVDITGTLKQLSNTTYLSTAPIDVTDASENISKDITVILPNSVSLLTPSQRIHVTIKISAFTQSKEISTNNFSTINADSYNIISYSPTELTVICLGPPTLVNNLSSKDVSVILNLQDKAPDANGNITIQLSNDNFTLPTGVVMSSFSPETISVKVK
jgi:YbbR domain-containing protein